MDDEIRHDATKAALLEVTDVLRFKTVSIA